MTAVIRSGPQRTMEDSSSRACQQQPWIMWRSPTSRSAAVVPGLAARPPPRHSATPLGQDGGSSIEVMSGRSKSKSAHPSATQPCCVGPVEWLMDSCLLTLLELMPGLFSWRTINKGPPLSPFIQARLKQAHCHCAMLSAPAGPGEGRDNGCGPPCHFQDCIYWCVIVLLVGLKKRKP